MLISASKSHEMPLQLDAVKKCFTGMMTTHRDEVKAELKKLVDRVKHMGKILKFLEAFAQVHYCIKKKKHA